MHRRAALTITGAIALTIAAGSAAMAANLGILDADNGVDVGDLSPVGSSSSVSTPVTVDDHGTDITTPGTVGSTTPATVDDHGDDNTPNTVGTTPNTVDDRGDDTPNTVGTTPNTVDDHGGDTDHSGPGRDGDTDVSRSGRDGGDDHSGPGGGGGDNSGPGSSDD
jgi:hypothetical protein